MSRIRGKSWCLLTILLVAITVMAAAPSPSWAKMDIQFTEAEKALIARTQNGNPIKIGIIPHAFPLSDCPPEAPTFTGTNVEMLSLITDASGLQFEYHRVPTEQGTPYYALKQNMVQLVAGTIKLDVFLSNPELVLSDRFCDGSAICIATSNANVGMLKTGKVAVMHGYQAGVEFSRKQFPEHEVVLYPNNKEVVKAVRDGRADLAMISRYVGIYELQSPFNENLTVLAPYQMLVDSCIMGLNTPESRLAVSIINKALAKIGDDEANHVQMHFSISHPYQFTPLEFVFKYRYIILTALIVMTVLGIMAAKLLSTRKEGKILARDPLTGALSEAGFELEVSKVIAKSDEPLFITDFDISHFSAYNELHGKEKGDELLKEIVKIVKSFLCEQDVICRSYADKFKVLSQKDTIDDLIVDIKTANIMFNRLIENRMVFKFGVYPITDKTIPIGKMLDFAAAAKKNVKNDPNLFIGIFDSKLHDSYVCEAKILEMFDAALDNNEFVAYYQPKFDTISQRIIGAEALARWVKPDGQIIPPNSFIGLLEKNGQIKHLDFHILEQVCMLISRLIANGIEVVPISVNFSRVHMFSDNFINKINQMVECYNVPKHLIEIECTETAIAFDVDVSKDVLGRLQSLGFKIAMDDFGQAYSSLNTLRTMPLDVVKLDRGFMLSASDEDRERSKKIIKNVSAMLRDLSLKIVAEGVETEGQYIFLKSVGCDYIQGYYFSRPVDEQSFVNMLKQGK